MIRMELDTKDFDKALAEYMKFSKKSVSEIINAKCYFIARNATNTTKATDKSKIDLELDGPSKVNPEAPLAAIIINSKNGKQGKRGLSGRMMALAIQKMKNARKRSINFLRSGWLPAIRILETALKRGDIKFARRFAPKVNRDVKQKGVDKGNAIWARPERERTFGEIENKVQGGKEPSPRVHNILVEGLQKAIKQEVASMRLYIERKLNPEIANFNK